MNGIFEQIAPDRIRMAVKTEAADRHFTNGLDRYDCREFFRDRLLALEALWAAVKHWEASDTGYTPQLADAVKRLRELERDGG